MDAFWWIVAGGIAMSSIALVGSITLLMKDHVFKRLVLPLVAMSAGSLLGGALFHLLPAAIEEMGQGLEPYLWVLAGFSSFFVLEQFLHWHHCHRPTHQHKAPLTYLILIADGVHNFVGGLAVAGAFLADIRLGLVAWLAAAAHEVPQELGDFGILIHGGWSRSKALLFNLLSGLTFLVGGLVAYAASKQLDVAFLIPFGAGNFIYIAAVDLVPEINREGRGRRAVVHFMSFAFGVTLLLLVHLFIPHSHGPGGHDHGDHDHGAHQHDEAHQHDAHDHDHAHDHSH